MASEQLEGVVDRITYRDEESLYTVFQLELDSGTKLTAVGGIPAVHAGERARLDGSWRVHPRYGPQFHVERYTPVPPTTRQAIERYLASGMIKGVGPETAKRLVEAFGDETLEVIANHPERLTQVPGVGPKRAAAISEAATQQEDMRRAVLFLQGLGVSVTYALRIFRQYGADTVRVVSENPYRLPDEVWGIGFKRADEVARALGIGEDSPVRTRAAVLHVLNEAAAEGHVYLPHTALVDRLQALDVDVEHLTAALDELGRVNRIVTEKVPTTAEPRIYLRSLYQAEERIAKRIGELLAHVQPLQEQLVSAGDQLVPGGLKLSKEQLQAVEGVLKHGFIVITGGPGTGKTTVVRAIHKVLASRGLRIELAAPTGRAAQRLSEATGRPARTIHRLLEVRHAGGAGGAAFGRHEDNPLDTDVVIVDESSMIDTYLLQHLLAAIRPGTRVVLIGDEDQLPSVGPGQVLGDILRSGCVPVVRLTQVFRQAALSLIVENAHRIRTGQPPVSGRSDQDFFFMETPVEEIPDLIVELVGRRLPKFLGSDPVSSIQVLTPIRRGPMGVDALNQRLQAELNPAAGEEVLVGGRALRPSDKVMQIRNNYDTMVFNGDIGRVTGVFSDERCIEVTFLDSDGERVVRYDEENLDQLVHAYAVSVHKSQGSEYPCIVMPITYVMPALMTRNLLYTAVTRARRLVVLVGDRRALAAYVRNDRAAERYTGLKERLSALV